MHTRHVILAGFMLLATLGQAPTPPATPVNRIKEVSKLTAEIRSAKAYQKRYESMLERAEAQYAYVSRKGYLREIPIKRKKVADTRTLLEKQNEKVNELEKQLAYLTSVTRMVQDTLLTDPPEELQPTAGGEWTELAAGRARAWIKTHINDTLKGKVVQFTLRNDNSAMKGDRAQLTVSESHNFEWGPVQCSGLAFSAVFKPELTDKLAKVPKGAKIIVTGPVSAMAFESDTASDAEGEQTILTVTLDPCDYKYSVFMQK